MPGNRLGILPRQPAVKLADRRAFLESLLVKWFRRFASADFLIFRNISFFCASGELRKVRKVLYTVCALPVRCVFLCIILP